MRSILSLLMVGVLAVCSLSVVGASAIAMLGGYENMDADIISAQESSESQENAAVNERATAITDKGIADAFKVDCAANGPFSGYGATLIAQGNALFAEGIRTGKPNSRLPTFETAVELHRFIDTIKQASDEGRTLDVT